MHSSTTQKQTVNDSIQDADKLIVGLDLKKYINSDKYQIQQPYIQIKEEGYTIQSIDGTEVFKASRPRQWMKTFVSKALSWMAFAIVFFISAAIYTMYFSPLKPGAIEAAPSEEIKQSLMTGMILLTLISLTVGMLTYFTVAKLTAPKRKLILSDVKSNSTVFSLVPTSGEFILNHSYCAQDANNKTLAIFKKNTFDSFLRKKWHCYDSNNKYLFTATEDSLFRSLLRRYLGFGKFIPMHFYFSKSQGKSFGEFIRKFSIKDKYKLNFDSHVIDGSLALAMALLLDTGENR